MKLTFHEFPAESQYRRRSDQELRHIALQIIRGEVFGSWMLKDPSLLVSVFMPLALLDDIQRKALVRDGAAQFFAQMKHSTGVAINGVPTFMAMDILDAEDCRRLSDLLKTLQATIGAFERGDL